MFKDFRPNLSPRSTPEPPTLDEVEQLLKKGELIKAAKTCRRCGFELERCRPALEKCARKLWHGHQANVVVSFMDQTGFVLDIDPDTLLRSIIECGDWHGFLKSAYRLKRRNGLEKEIDSAIQHLIEKNQVTDANAWRKKFDELSR